MVKSELYVFANGELTKKICEAKRMIEKCHKKHKCRLCDGEIHQVVIERTKQTFKESESHGKW